MKKFKDSYKVFKFTEKVNKMKPTKPQFNDKLQKVVWGSPYNKDKK